MTREVEMFYVVLLVMFILIVDALLRTKRPGAPAKRQNESDPEPDGSIVVETISR